MTLEEMAEELLPCHPSGYCKTHAHHHFACVAGNSRVSREQIASALARAHAEGKAEGLEEAARHVDEVAEALWRFGGFITAEQFKAVARHLRSLIPAAPEVKGEERE